MKGMFVPKKADAADKDKVVIEIKHGVDRSGPKRCLHCKRLFTPDDCWHKIWDPDHAYAVGIHTSCVAASRHQHRN